METNPAGSGDPDAPSLSDPQLVNKLVDELKSQGIFDQIRSDCLAEVDTKVSSFFLHRFSLSHKDFPLILRKEIGCVQSNLSF